jgi:hypothetical protein
MIINSVEDAMIHNVKKRVFLLYVILGLLFLFLPLKIETVNAHGGKGHDSGAFTPLMAVQKAAELFDQLISLNKLDDMWETRLIRIDVIRQKAMEKQEFVVSFRRNSGNPDVVYFFFDLKGMYTGSNFTGK